MHLLDIHTLELEEVKDETCRQYAILSHVWEEGQELLFADIETLKDSRSTGADKIRSFCKLICARNASRRSKYQIHHVWVDTCCIDKKSSAELSEAINAMYSYYATARFCVVFLNDVSADPSHPSFEEEFAKSKWFTRCWTLQELLAPGRVFFHNKYWRSLGTRTKFAHTLSKITRIDTTALRGTSIFNFSVAQRMSWAAGRQATRKEDVAYSLMGLFDVNMPMLYGEGNKAFRRLQEAILKDIEDETIFAWSWDHLPESEKPDGNGHCGLLATSPDYFINCGSVVPTLLNEKDVNLQAINQGIGGKMALCWNLIEVEPKIRMALLNATRRTDHFEYFVVIFLEERTIKGEWSRVPWGGSSLAEHSIVQSRELRPITEHIYVRHKERLKVARPAELLGFDLSPFISRFFPAKNAKDDPVFDKAVQFHSQSSFLRDNCLFNTITRPSGPLILLDCAHFLGINHLVQLGFDRHGFPTVIVLEFPDEKVGTEDLKSLRSSTYHRLRWNIDPHFGGHKKEISQSPPTCYHEPGRDAFGHVAIRCNYVSSETWGFGLPRRSANVAQQDKLVFTIKPAIHGLGAVWSFDIWVRKNFPEILRNVPMTISSEQASAAESNSDLSEEDTSGDARTAKGFSVVIN